MNNWIWTNGQYKSWSHSLKSSATDQSRAKSTSSWQVYVKTFFNTCICSLVFFCYFPFDMWLYTLESLGLQQLSRLQSNPWMCERKRVSSATDQSRAKSTSSWQVYVKTFFNTCICSLVFFFIFLLTCDCTP